MTKKAPFEVMISRRVTSLRDPFWSFKQLRQRFGLKGCFLLESLAGPEADRGRAVVGFGTLATISVRGQVVQVHSDVGLADELSSRLIAEDVVRAAGTGATSGQLELTGPLAFWDLQRVVRDCFEVADTRPDEYTFGLFVLYGYDAVRHIENLPTLIPTTDDFPELVLVISQACVTYDLHANRAEIVISESVAWPAIDASEIAKIIETDSQSQGLESGPLPRVPAAIKIQDSVSAGDYRLGVERALDYIADGDIYQVQLGHELTITSEADPLAVYERLRQRNPSPYMCYVDLGLTTLISASPELFLRINGAEMTMRPIAGTATRTGDIDIDDARIKALLADEKERAEHLMLIDLCRNDLGRVAEIGTVEVNELMAVENFSHVFHLVSNVEARKAAEPDAFDVIQATFPAGTMTGAPKIRAMEVIEEIETTRRGGYAGAFGLLDVGGFVNTGLTIRSIFQVGQQYRLRASGGVVADSTPSGEWRETLAKLSATYWAVTDRELLIDQAETTRQESS